MMDDAQTEEFVQSANGEDNECDESSCETNNDELLAQRETRALRLLRALLGLILITATALASWLVFRFMRKAEQQAFLSEFVNYADKVIHTVRSNAERRIQGIDALSVALTFYAKSVDAKWPLVTVPDFDILGASAITIAHATFAMVLPIVHTADRAAWEQYSVNNQGWLSQPSGVWVDGNYSQDNTSNLGAEFRDLSVLHARMSAINSTSNATTGRSDRPSFSAGISNEIYEFTKEGPSRSEGPGPFLPLWQLSPRSEIPPMAINFNVISLPDSRNALNAALSSEQAVVGELMDYQVKEGDYKDYGLKFARPPQKEPYSNIIYPVFDDFTRNRTLVAILFMDFAWGRILRGILPNGTTGVDTVIENSCGQSMTYQIQGRTAVYLGVGDLHDRSFDSMETTLSLNSGLTGAPDSVKVNTLYCPYTVRIYPSKAFHEARITNKPIVMTVIVIAIIGFTSLIFFTYDRLVERRQTKVMQTAVRSNRIVSSLFPSNVRDRLFQINEPSQPGLSRIRQGIHLASKKSDGWRTTGDTPKHRLKVFLTGENGDQTSKAAKPIADLFPNATVLFADISGFTAWSSAREPSQVFTLLETVYNAFDKIAKRKGVFKVETIGDCYMAVTGLPEPQEHHAVVMAEFAEDCLAKMKDVVRKLELTLGPDTADLSVRIGIHSGPVTAGVLRSEKSRFQLFGDTVNTASRMESTGQMNRIQLSSTSASLLYAAGKKDWTIPREDKVFAKGKGEMSTFWLDSKRSTRSLGRSTTVSTVDTRDIHVNVPNKLTIRNSECVGASDRLESQISIHKVESIASQSKLKRLIRWNAKVLLCPLKAIVAHRELELKRKRQKGEDPASVKRLSLGENVPAKALTILDEVVEVITIPQLERQRTSRLLDDESFELKPEVKAQLLDFVTAIASLYQDNPFHSFQHASHVTMSANKLLQRIVTMDSDSTLTKSRPSRHDESHLHDKTFGIASDPLVQFAILFAALIHDVDHPGVPNMKLVELKTELAVRYQNKSVAEQNSVDIAWKLLMAPKYDELRNCIAATDEELQRFRQLVVNLVMATDVLDRELQELRTSRWTRAFHDLSSNSEVVTPLSNLDASNRKATVVIEHIIQASDVAHTMQHWQMFAKWNERLFRELYSRYVAGDGDMDPSIHWYQRELEFFDGYVIPLANKLKECGVFGVSGDEYLTYATENRREWVQKGERVVCEMVAACQQDLEKEVNQTLSSIDGMFP